MIGVRVWGEGEVVVVVEEKAEEVVVVRGGLGGLDWTVKENFMVKVTAATAATARGGGGRGGRDARGEEMEIRLFWFQNYPKGCEKKG